jgi:hypothetical protein
MFSSIRGQARRKRALRRDWVGGQGLVLDASNTPTPRARVAMIRRAAPQGRTVAATYGAYSWLNAPVISDKFGRASPAGPNSLVLRRKGGRTCLNGSNL